MSRKALRLGRPPSPFAQPSECRGDNFKEVKDFDLKGRTRI
jgi:hypothetical protein